MSKQLLPYVGLAVLLVGSFLALDCVYGYVIAFQSETNDCFFLFGRSFLAEFLDHPGGLLHYSGRFLAQFYHYQWLGALIVSASITCFGFLLHRVLVKLDRSVPVAQTLLPCVVLLALHVSTFYQVYDTLGLCASCGAFWGYLLFRGKSGRRVYALAATPVAYLLLGAHAWLFVAWVVAFEWLGSPLRSGLLFKIGYVVFAVAVVLAAWRWVFLMSLQAAFVGPVMLHPPYRTGSPHHTLAYFAVDCCLAVALLVLLAVMPFWTRVFSGTRLASFWRAKPDARSRVMLAVALCVLAVLLHWIRYDAPLATYVACHRLYEDRQWDALLEKAGENPFRDVRVQFMTNFALCQQGKLLDEMFSYPQIWGSRGLVFNYSGKPVANPAEDDTDKGMYNSDLFFEMGQVNVAFRHAYNCMCLQERTYDVMKRMAQCSMANGNYAMAAKYLNLLEKTLFHREFALRYKAIIADPAAAEREFADVRERFPRVDGNVFGQASMPMLLSIEAKPDNRMATDYLMAWLLLDKTENSIVSICCPRGITQFRKAGYASIPIHCQELLLLRERNEQTRLDLQGYRYDEAIRSRVEKFVEDLAIFEDRPDAAEDALAVYGDTYLFYYFFVTTPVDAQRAMPTEGGFGGVVFREE